MKLLVSILTFFFLFSIVLSQPLPKPKFAASETQFNRAKKAVEDYIATIVGDPDRRVVSEPLYQFHPPGVKTYGTVIFWHGITDRPSNESLIGRYLFENKFNVFLAPLAGHSLEASRWPSTILRESKGLQAARSIILADPELRNIIDSVNNGTLPPPVLQPTPGFNLSAAIDRMMIMLKKGLSASDFKNVRKAVRILTTENYFPGLEKKFFRFFNSDHTRYESTPLEQLSLVSALPGPVYLGGFSLGAIQALYATARSKYVKRQVLLAPFFDVNTPKALPEVKLFFEVVGAFDLYTAPNPFDTNVPSRILPAAETAGRFSTQDEITRNARTHTATFCAMSPNDNIASFRRAMHICKGPLTNSRSVTFNYPKENTDLGHFISPGFLNPFSEALAKEILRFYVTGKVNVSFLNTVQGDPKLSPLPPLGSDFPISKNGTDDKIER